MQELTVLVLQDLIPKCDRQLMYKLLFIYPREELYVVVFQKLSDLVMQVFW